MSLPVLTYFIIYWVVGVFPIGLSAELTGQADLGRRGGCPFRKLYPRVVMVKSA
jgi:hypothetical protein